jgi:hypothetical protein
VVVVMLVVVSTGVCVCLLNRPHVCLVHV